MALSEIREQIYQGNNEDIYCYECNELLEPEESFTCEECQQDFCKNCLNTHKC